MAGALELDRAGLDAAAQEIADGRGQPKVVEGHVAKLAADADLRLLVRRLDRQQRLIPWIDEGERNSKAFQVFRGMKSRPEPDLGQGRFMKTQRHITEVDLWKLIKTLNFLRSKISEPD